MPFIRHEQPPDPAALQRSEERVTGLESEVRRLRTALGQTYESSPGGSETQKTAQQAILESRVQFPDLD
jgi:hypothetical protein